MAAKGTYWKLNTFSYTLYLKGTEDEEYSTYTGGKITTRKEKIKSVIVEEECLLPSDCRQMFGDCSLLTSLDLSNFNTSNVTVMLGMFDGCTALTSIDLSSFNTSKVWDISN